ncbi:hypothetical protein ACWDA3_23605 [Nonomuraea rubra]
MNWWKKVWEQESQRWNFGLLGEGFPIEPESVYVSVHLRAMHIANVRVGLQKFYGSVISSCTLPSRGGVMADFMVVTTPEKLRDVDAENLDRVISGTVTLLSEVPYRGGGLGLQIGLFSTPETDLLAPFLDTLQALASTVGVGFIATATEWAGPLRKGLDLLMGAANGPQLEIGLQHTFDKPATGIYFVTRTTETGTYDVGKDYRLLLDGQEVRDPYLIFEVTVSPRRDSWAMIPEIQRAYQDVIAATLMNVDATKAAMAMFRRAAVLSPDLLAEDGVRLHTRIHREVSLAMPATGTGGRDLSEMPALTDINLYDD